MRWIRRGMKLGQAVKNVGRLRQIIGVLSKYGFVDVVDRMNLGKFLPSRLAAFAQVQADKSPAERIRLAFEELGPTFVKLGQLLSTRPDLVPDAYIEEFTRLQDNVQPLPFEIVRAVLEAELGGRLTERFDSISSEPLAAASIAQVHEARLKTGENVVIKVQRPEIGRMIDTDISLLAFLAGLLERYVPEVRFIGPKTIVDEFFRTLSYELDFVVEANNMAKMTENMASIPEIVIPKVHKELSTHRVLTLERLEGVRVNDGPGLERAGIDKKLVVDVGARAFFKSVMIDGLFHGDLHAGNLFVLPGNRLGIIDFGIVGRLSQRSRDQLANMMMSLLSEDYENLCYQYSELGATGPAIDFDAFQREVRNTLSPYVGLSLKELNLGRVLIEATKIAAKYSIKIPGDWMIVFKAIVTIEGMGRTLDPTFDLIKTGEQLVKDLVRSQYSIQRVSKDALWIAKDVASLLQTVPRQIRWMFKKFSSNDFAFEIKLADLADIRAQLDSNSRRTSSGIIGAGLFVAAAIALQHTEGRVVGGYPILSVIFMAGGVFFSFNAVFRPFR